MKKYGLIFGILFPAVFCAHIYAQDPLGAKQAELEKVFKLNTVIVKLDMPAVSKGVDIMVEKKDKIDGNKYFKRLKNYGIAIRNGERVYVTGIRVLKNEISFELDGGGAPEEAFNTRITPEAPPPAATSRQANARNTIINSAPTRPGEPSRGGDSAIITNARSTIQYETSRQERANVAARIGNVRQGDMRTAAQKMGSRFVIKLGERHATSVTPDELMKLLSAYVSF